MRHIIAAILAVAFFGIIASAQEPQAPAAEAQEQSKKVEKKDKKEESPMETIARLSVSPEGETPGEKRVRLKALEILLEQEGKRAKNERIKTLTPAELKAEGEIAKADKKEAKSVEVRRKAKIDTGLLCKTEEDYDKVWIAGVSAKRWQATSHSSMTIVNNTDAWIQIRRVSGVGGPIVVDNFCPRGTITLQERLPTLTGSMEVAYTAINLQEEGPAIINQSSPRVVMYKCQYIGCQWEFSAQWRINER